MNFISFTPAETRNHEEVFLAEVNKLLLMQQEVNEMQELLDKIMEATHKREFLHGHVVEFEKIISMKQISDALEPKKEALKNAILNLHNSLFPHDIFLTQNFFDVWISLHPDWVIRFPYDFESIEIRNNDGQLCHS